MNEVLARIQVKWPDRIVKARGLFLRLQCPVFSDGYWLYHDRTHFTVAGSYYMVNHAEAPFTKFLQSTLIKYRNDHNMD